MTPTVTPNVHFLETCWIATEGLSVMGRLRLIERMLEIRPDLIPELEAIIFSATDPDGEAWDEDDDGHHLRAGMDELRRRRGVIPLPLATAFATAKRPNLHYAGISAIGAHATREALDLLLVLHRTANRHRSRLLEEIETLAARFGVVIMPADLA